MKKRKKQTGRLSMVFGTIEVNGTTLSGINYERITYDDGSIEEKGLPPGVPKGLSLPTLMELASKTILGE